MRKFEYISESLVKKRINSDCHCIDCKHFIEQTKREKNFKNMYFCELVDDFWKAPTISDLEFQTMEKNKNYDCEDFKRRN